MSRPVFYLAWAGLIVGCCSAIARDTSPVGIGSLELDDPLESLVPKDGRGEREQDQVTASALFAYGRLLYQRQDFAGALQRYQRAWRYDPQAVSILREIVPLAFNLQRNDEAARYAMLAPDLAPEHLNVLRRLALHLTQQQDFRGAVRLYEKSHPLSPEPDQTGFLLAMEMGRLYFLAGEHEKSAESLTVVRDALADPEKYGLEELVKKAVLGQAEQTYGLMAESFLQAGRFEEAAEMFRQSDQANPNKGKLALQLARVEAEQDHTDAALQQLDIYLDEKLGTEGTEPYELYFSLLKTKLADDKQALDAVCQRLEKLYEDDPANAALSYTLANRYREQGKLTEAEKIYRETLQIQAALDGYSGLVDVYQSQQDVDKLLDALGEAVSQVGEVDRLGSAAERLLENEQLVDKLIATAKQRMKEESKQLGDGVALAMALIAMEVKRFDDSAAFFEQALKSPEPSKRQIMFAWGLGLLMADESQRAARVLRKAIEENVVPDDNPDFHFYLAGALELSGKTDEALAVAKEAAAKMPDDPRYQSRVPWILYHAKRYDEAEKAYLQLLANFGASYGSSSVREAVHDAKLVLSYICVHQRQIDDAVEWLEQVLDEFPEDVGALNDLGYLWADENQHLLRAVAMTRKAVASEPDNAAYRDSLGWALYRVGEYDEAVEQLEEAAADEDPDGVILDHLGDAYWKAGQNEKAIETWQRGAQALEDQDDVELLNKIKAKIKQNTAE